MTRGMITIEQSAVMWLFDTFEVEPICKFCGIEITKENFGALYNKPTVVICNSLPCLIKFNDETDEE